MNKKIVSLAIGSAFMASFFAGVVNAAKNPFGMNDLQNNYQVAMSSKPAEGKCGGSKSKTEGKCGGSKTKKEGKCGDGKSSTDKPKTESKCGGA